MHFPLVHRFTSIQPFFLTAIILLIGIVTFPLLFSGLSIINTITSQFGNEILTEQLKSLTGPVDLRYQTLKRVGLEDSDMHRQEIRENALLSMGRYRYKKSGTVFVVEKNGTLLLSTDFADSNDDGFAQFFAQMVQAPTIIEFQVTNGNHKPAAPKRIGVAHYYPPWDAFVGLAMDREELFAPRDLFLRTNLLVLLVVLFATSLFALAIHRLIITPIVRITRFAEQVSGGDLQAQIPGRFVLELETVKKDVMEMVASLVSREEKYRAVFNAPRDAIFVHDAETGEILEVNRAVQAMYGYTPEETLSLDMGDLSSCVHPYTLEEAGRRIAEAAEARHLRFEWHGKKKNNNLFWVDVSLRLFSYGDRQCVLALVRDIDEQKKGAEELAAEKEQLMITLRSIGDGVITTDEQGRIVLINKVAETLTGWLQQEAVGKLLDEVLHRVDAKTNVLRSNLVLEVLKTRQQFEQPGDTVLIARDGSRREVTDSAAPIFDSSGQIAGVVLVFRDITEKRRFEHELLKIKKLESVGVLAGGIAHDFNNLLAAILGNINLCRLEISTDSKLDRLLGEAEKASLRAQRLTQQLLTFSTGGDPVRQTTDLAEIIRDNAGFVLRGSQARYDFKAPDDLWEGDIDPGQIGQVIQNIILNARQAMGEDGGLIEITAENCRNCIQPKGFVETCIHIQIKDNGPGIPPETLEKIFDPYFSTKEEGSGLGLAICHAIMQKHEGMLQVKSELGKGTVFTLKLPNAQFSLPNLRNKAVTADDCRPLKVLVMDDEKMLRDLAANMLAVLGHVVESAKDGDEALVTYQQAKELGAPFDLVIMDLTIPGGMGGKEAMARLRELDSQAKVVVASGYSNDPVMANFKDYGFVAMLEKPFRLQDLEQVFMEIQ